MNVKVGQREYEVISAIYKIQTGYLNDVPQGAIEIDAEEYSRLKRFFSIVAVEWRYAQRKHAAELHGYWFIEWFWSGQGVAILIQQDGNMTKMRLFSVGCNHEWVEYANPAMFDHRYRCAKCGVLHHVDSSG